MADSRFIKLTAFGGYDKADVDKRLETLYDLVYKLKNEVRETKTLLKKFEDGSDQQKAYDNAIAVERAQLTHLQLKMQNLNEKHKSIKAESSLKDEEIEKLRAENEELKKKLDDADIRIKSLSSSNNAEALSVIFIEAQKSRELVVSTAQKEAEDIENASKKIVEEFVTETNNKASKIIYEAERQAAEIVAEARTNSENMKINEENLRTVMLADVEKMSSEMKKLHEIFDSFEKLKNDGLSMLSDSESILNNTGAELKNGGVPMFNPPVNYAPEYPAEPVYESIPAQDTEPAENIPAVSEEVVAEAAVLENESDKTENDTLISPEKETKKKSTIDLNDLLKQANALTE